MCDMMSPSYGDELEQWQHQVMRRVLGLPSQSNSSTLELGSFVLQTRYIQGNDDTSVNEY